MNNHENKEELLEEDNSEEADESRVLGQDIRKPNKEKVFFSNGNPFVTYIFIIIQVAVFFYLELNGGSTNNSTLIKFGAKFNYFIFEGEWWRFFTPIFLHIGFLHLATNTLSLYYLGTLVERMYGNLRFVIIYLFAGAAGFIASFLYSPSVSAGASGAIFGCFGSLLYFGMVHPKLFSRTIGANVIGILVINLAFGFMVPSIDNAGHLGGLAGGFLGAGMVHFPKKRKPLFQSVFFILSSIIVWVALTYGFSDQVKAKDESHLLLVQDYVNQEKYEEAYRLLKKYEQSSLLPSANFYFTFSFVEIKLGLLTEGKTHLQKAIQLNPNFPEAYYNLALIFYEEGNVEQAKLNAQKAAKLKPKQQEYLNLLQELKLIPSSSDGEE
nr:rhomboid family intramembrane serine protease [Neobacillus sp. Marseille-Q6967]